MRSMFENSSCVRPRSRMRPSAGYHNALGKIRDDFHIVANHDNGATALGHGAHRFHDGHALAVIKGRSWAHRVQRSWAQPLRRRQSATICRWPRESENGASSAGRPKRSMTSWARRRASARSMPPSSRPKATSSSTVSLQIWRSGFGRGSRPRERCGSWERLRYPVP